MNIFTLNTIDGVAIVNGLGQTKVYFDEVLANRDARKLMHELGQDVWVITADLITA